MKTRATCLGLCLGLISTLVPLIRSTAIAQATSDVAPPEELVESAPVVLDGNQLFEVVGIKAYPADKRARIVTERIVTVARDRSISPDSMITVESDIATTIEIGGKSIMSVTDADAALSGLERDIVARVYLARIREATSAYRQSRDPNTLVRNAAYALLATAGLAITLFLLKKLYRRLALLEARYRQRITSVQIQSLELVRAERIQSAFLAILGALRVVVIVALVYGYLSFVLYLFPWTRFIAVHLSDYVALPVRAVATALVAYTPNLITIAVFIVVARYVLKLVGLYFAGLEKGTVKISGFDPEWATPTLRLARFFVIVFFVIIIYPYVPGADSPAFKGISIFLGVVLSLGSSSAVANIIAGFMMTYRRAFRIGDRVKIGEFFGEVIEVRLLVTHLRTVKNEEVVIPNNVIINGDVINYSSLSREKGLILHTTATIGYDVPWRQVHALLLLAAERTPGVLTNPEPFVLQKSLDDFYVTYELNAYTVSPHDMNKTYSELHQNILDAFNEYGVQIMSPGYESDPDRPKMVPKERWFEAPARPPAASGTQGGT